MEILRKTLDGAVTEFDFGNVKSERFLVVNFSQGNMFASFDEDLDESKSAKIAAGMGRIILDSARTIGGIEQYRHSKVYVKGTGECEVQAIWQ